MLIPAEHLQLDGPNPDVAFTQEELLIRRGGTRLVGRPPRVRHSHFEYSPHLPTLEEWRAFRLIDDIPTVVLRAGRQTLSKILYHPPKPDDRDLVWLARGRDRRVP